VPKNDDCLGRIPDEPGESPRSSHTHLQHCDCKTIIEMSAATTAWALHFPERGRSILHENRQHDQTELAEDRTSLTVANDLAVRRALEAAGVEFIDEDGGGPGVRLRERRRPKTPKK
jgi:hypothetical protein